ncbi:MAG: FxSxx-COOH system tetratricopeptide repeat protein [Chitinophagaceae bacterium]
MNNNAHIFISCVSDEFGHFRDAIRRDLSRPNLDTKIQEDFVAYGGATLEKLNDYIRHCEAVIHFAGDMTGSMANALSIQYINTTYPDFGDRFPHLKPVLSGVAVLSYTQWEAYLAMYHGKRLFVVTPSDKAARGERYKKDDEQTGFQQAHLNSLKGLGYYDEIKFATEDELVKKLFQSKLGDLLNALPKNKPVNLPYKSIGTAFKGRQREMNELREWFSAAANDAMAIAVHGLGGMGKTRLAVEYAWKNENSYTALLFITASSPDLLKSNVANLSSVLQLDFPGEDANKEDVKYQAVVNWMNRFSGWLLVIDNVDTREAAKNVEEFFARLQQGHVLITTRVDRWGMQVKKKQLDVLSESDAAAFLLETTVGEREQTANDNELARAIANDVGFLALALEQARAYIVTHELSFEAYRKKWEKGRADVLSWFDEQLMQYPASVAITWQTSFSQLSGNAITLLNRLAWLAPERIPKTLLEVEWTDAENIDAQAAWAELKQYSLTASTEDKKAFTVHKLVQEVTMGKLDEASRSQTLVDALEWIDKASEGDATNVSDWPRMEPFIPHMLSLAGHALLKKINVPTSDFLTKVGLLYLQKARYVAAEPLLKKALHLDEQSLGRDNAYVARGLNNLAQLLKSTNRFAEAETLMRRALEIDERVPGSDPLLVARDLSNLAGILQITNRFGEAEPLIRRALKIDEEHFGASHPKVARRLNNLASLLLTINRLTEAEPLMVRALEIDERRLESNDPDLAIRLNNLAQLYLGTDRLQQAGPLMFRALKILEQRYGPDHPDVAGVLNNLAQLYRAANRLQDAETLMRRALEIDKQSFGPDHANVAKRLNNLAQHLLETGRAEEAEPLFIKSLEINEQRFGKDHSEVANVLNNYAQLLKDTGRLQEAESLMRRALEIDEHRFGSNHTSVAIDLNNLAELLKITNRRQEAEPLLKQAIVIFVASLGATHPNTKKVLTNYILLLKEKGLSDDKLKSAIDALLIAG